MKQMTGTVKARAIPARSAKCPITGVRAAPPMIDITISAPPVFVRVPNPFTPSAKMVGNIMDMKNPTVTRQPTPSQPGRNAARAHVTALTSANPQSSRCAGIKRNSHVETNLPTVNATSAAREPIARSALSRAGIGLHVRDEVTPDSHLGAHIEELCNHGVDEVLSRPQRLGVVRGNGVPGIIHPGMGKGRARNQNCPDQDHRSQDEIGRDHP